MSLRSMEMFLDGDDYDPLAMPPIREHPGEEKPKGGKKRMKRRTDDDKKESQAAPEPDKATSPAKKPAAKKEEPAQIIGTGAAAKPKKRASGGGGGCCGGGRNRIDEDIAARVRAYDGQGSAQEGDVLELQLGGDDGTHGINAKTLEMVLYRKTARLRKVRLMNFDPWNPSSMHLVNLLRKTYEAECQDLAKRRKDLIDLIAPLEQPTHKVEHVLDDETWAARRVLMRKHVYHELGELRLMGLVRRADFAGVDPKRTRAAIAAAPTEASLQCDLEVWFKPRLGTGGGRFWSLGEEEYWEEDADDAFRTETIDKNSWDYWQNKQPQEMQLASPAELIQSVTGKSGQQCEACFATLDNELKLADHIGTITRDRAARGLDAEAGLLKSRIETHRSILEQARLKEEDKAAFEQRSYLNYHEVQLQQDELKLLRNSTVDNIEHYAHHDVQDRSHGIKKTASRNENSWTSVETTLQLSLLDQYARERWRRRMALQEEIKMELAGMSTLELITRARKMKFKQHQLEKLLGFEEKSIIRELDCEDGKSEKIQGASTGRLLEGLPTLMVVKNLLLAPKVLVTAHKKASSLHDVYHGIVGFQTLAWKWCDGPAIKDAFGEKVLPDAHPVIYREHDWSPPSLDLRTSTPARENNTEFVGSKEYKRQAHAENTHSKLYWESSTAARLIHDSDIRDHYELVIKVPLGQFLYGANTGSPEKELLHYQKVVFETVKEFVLVRGEKLAQAEAKKHNTELLGETLAERAAGFVPKWALLPLEHVIEQIYENIEEQQGDGGVVTPVMDRAWTERAGQLAMVECLEGLRVLLFLDDVWTTRQFSALAHVDFNMGARVAVTSRVEGIFEKIRALHTKTESLGERIHKQVGVVEVESSYIGVALSDKWHAGTKAVARASDGTGHQTTVFEQIEQEKQAILGGDSRDRLTTFRAKMLRGAPTVESKEAMRKLRTALTTYLTDIKLKEQADYISETGWIDERRLTKQIRMGCLFGDKELTDLSRALPYIGCASQHTQKVLNAANDSGAGKEDDSKSKPSKAEMAKGGSGTNGRGGSREATVGNLSVMAGGPKADLTIDLRNNQIGNAGAKALAAALPRSSVVHVDLSGNQEITQEGWQALWAAEEETNRNRGLILPTGSIEKLEGALTIEGFAPQAENGVIDWLGKKVGDVACIAFAKRFEPESAEQDRNRVTEIIMQDNELTDVAALSISRGHMLATPTLLKLNLSHNNISDMGCVGLAHALCGSSVEDLNLSNNLITSLGIFAICMVLQGDKAFKRDLPGGLHWRKALAKSFDQHEGRDMASDSRQARLIAVDLCETLQLNSRLSPEEVVIAARAKLGIRWDFPSMPADLSGVAISRREAGAKAGWDNKEQLQQELREIQEWTAQMRCPARLVSLTMRNCQVNDDGAEAMAAVLVDSQLNWLNLKGNGLTQQGYEYLTLASKKAKRSITLS